MSGARRVDIPTVGWYSVRLVKHGPQVPARILNYGDAWMVLLRGNPTGPANADPWRVEGMERVAQYGRLISENEYHDMLERDDAARPGEPLHDPTTPVDLRKSRSLF